MKLRKVDPRYLRAKTGELYERRTDNYGELDGECGDCGVKLGEIHHYGCDVEVCPKCGRQLISCPCKLKLERLKHETTQS